jgi:hypothetical protein
VFVSNVIVVTKGKNDREKFRKGFHCQLDGLISVL